MVYTHELYAVVDPNKVIWEEHPHDRRLQVARMPWILQCPASTEEKAFITCSTSPARCMACNRQSCVKHRCCPTLDSTGAPHGLRYSIPMALECNLFLPDIPRQSLTLSQSRGFENVDTVQTTNVNEKNFAKRFTSNWNDRHSQAQFILMSRCICMMRAHGGMVMWEAVKREPEYLIDSKLYFRADEDAAILADAENDARLIIDTYNLDSCTRNIAKVGLYAQVANPPGEVCTVVLSYLQPGFPDQVPDERKGSASMGMKLYNTRLNSFRIPSNASMTIFFNNIQLPPE